MELGSEYDLDVSRLSKTDNNIFRYLNKYKKTYYYDSGRSAIRQFAKLLAPDQRILLPEYICESVISCFKRDNINFYRVNVDFSINIDDLASKMCTGGGVLFLMHYYGMLQPSDKLDMIRKIADKNDYVILEDTTHSIFSASRTIGDYMVCSVRKWMPIPKGGVLYIYNAKLGLPTETIEKCTDNKRVIGFVLKNSFLNTGYDSNEEYRRIFRESEEIIDKQQNELEISDFSRFIIECVDINNIIYKRKNNAELLLTYLRHRVGYQVSYRPSDCPFAIPVRVPDRDSFRKYLMANRIYCAVHWPWDGIMEEDREQAVRNAKELISLPIDQRYNKEHIEYMIDIVDNYGGELVF